MSKIGNNKSERNYIQISRILKLLNGLVILHQIIIFAILPIIMKNEIIIYQNEDSSTKIEVRLEDETVWLTIEQISTLFGEIEL
jgi:hypothetical protein